VPIKTAHPAVISMGTHKLTAIAVSNHSYLIEQCCGTFGSAAPIYLYEISCRLLVLPLKNFPP